MVSIKVVDANFQKIIVDASLNVKSAQVIKDYENKTEQTNTFTIISFFSEKIGWGLVFFSEKSELLPHIFCPASQN